MLLVHLKRFSTKSPLADKVETFIEFPPKLDELHAVTAMVKLLITLSPNRSGRSLHLDASLPDQATQDGK